MKSAFAWESLGIMYDENKNINEALLHYQMALRFNPGK